MQYLLTQEEKDALVPKVELEQATEALSMLRRIAVPLGKCVHDPKGPAYCDFCPLSDIGNGQKLTRVQSKLMCNLSREYSQ